MATRFEDRYDAMSVTEIISNMGKSLSVGFKAAAQQMRFPGKAHWSEVFLGPRARLDFSKAVGDGRTNAIIMASVLWAARNFPEAPLAIEQVGAQEDSDVPLPDHPLIKLVRTPNPHYSGELLWKATIADWMFGNAYWRVIRGSLRKPVELWWIPSQLIEPKWGDTKSYVDYYEYRFDQTEEAEKIDPTDIVHFRNGLDPKNTRKGLSPLGALLREIFTDDEGANYTATLLSNLGVPGLVISPGSDNGKVAPEDAEMIKQQAEQKFTNENRGRAMVLSTKANVQILSFNPQQMQVRDIRTIPEERISAMLGIPAIVVGLGAGLQRSTFSNFSEAREAAYESFMIPSQRELAAELRTQLLPNFVPNPDSYKLFFDLTEVRVLQQDENDLHNRAQGDFKSGLIMLDEARDLIGQSPLPKNQGQLFAVGMSVTLTPPEELYVVPAPVPAALAPGANPPVDPNAPPASSTPPNPAANTPPVPNVPPTTVPPGKSADGHPTHSNGHTKEPIGAYEFKV